MVLHRKKFLRWASYLLVLVQALTLSAWAFAESGNVTQRISSAGAAQSYPHLAVDKHKVGEGGEAAWIFTPSKPVPSSAPVVVFMHGYRATDPYGYGGWIDHLVKKGNIVIYPIYEATRKDSDEQNINAAITGIKSAIAELKARGPVTPDTDKFAYVGHSFGGGLSLQLSALAKSAGLPVPKAVMAVQPGWKGGGRYPKENLPKVPSSILLVVVDGDQDQFADNREGKNIYKLTSAVPSNHKAYVVLQSDSEGGKTLIADHYAPLAPDPNYQLQEETRREKFRKGLITKMIGVREGEVDTLDTNGFWKIFDVLTENAFAGGTDISEVISESGGTSMGAWPGGRPVKPRLLGISQ